MKQKKLLLLIIIGGFLIMSCKNHNEINLSESQVFQIEAEIEKTAINHLNSKSAISALSYYTEDAKIRSNDILYSSFESFATEINEFYSNLSKIYHADYDEIHINVLAHDVAHFSAKFHWISTDTDGMKIDIKGTYSALYVLKDCQWKMSFRHESFAPLE